MYKILVSSSTCHLDPDPTLIASKIPDITLPPLILKRPVYVNAMTVFQEPCGVLHRPLLTSYLNNLTSRKMQVINNTPIAKDKYISAKHTIKTAPANHKNRMS